jgi:predicted lipoprotein with Yx(FWY)xxD motif
MRTTTIAWVVIILIVLAGGWYYYSTRSTASVAPPATSDTTEQPGPSGAPGINGSANQGNLGQPDAAVVQQPGAGGSVIGSNVALGTDRNAALGTYLIAYNGMTLYTFAKDTSSASTCYDACAQNWPPYVVGPEDNLTQLKAGITGKVDTTTRKDGSLQVTYNGHPLYFFAKDAKSGDTLGQNVGKVWFVVKP